MENKVEVFNHDVFGNLEVIFYDQKPTFYANDIATVLGYKDVRRARQHCKSLIKLNLADSAKLKLKSNGNHGTYLIGESDLYRMIMKSDLPYAEKFQDWVVEEVLPSIRKHGGYLQGQEEMSPEELMAKAVLMADSKIKELQASLAQKDKTIEQKTEVIAEKNFPLSLTRMFSGNNKVAQAANLWLEHKGYISKSFEKGMKKGWRLTEKGEELGHGVQHSKHSIFWTPRILEELPSSKDLLEFAESMDLVNWKKS